ncbi:unnamed protein product [Ceratitis capitata]|uniref:(Mediterranean fruit fly) hypothetical protein n=1 Tax=Ceratitis capitata TaxID=7213 RepID=A0A811U788_CERCA|nr:unnamed protein product [Ceratitis capitata]
MATIALHFSAFLAECLCVFVYGDNSSNNKVSCADMPQQPQQQQLSQCSKQQLMLCARAPLTPTNTTNIFPRHSLPMEVEVDEDVDMMTVWLCPSLSMLPQMLHLKTVGISTL